MQGLGMLFCVTTGCVYVGGFANGEKDGDEGLCVSKDGDFKCGKWAAGKLVSGFGRCRSHEVAYTEYIGTFTGEQRTGFG